MRLGIYGGSFDPVHYGHLLLAECCREQLQLDRVWFLPAAVPPHKQREISAAKHRVEMLRLALGGHESLEVSTLEIDRGGVSYTVDTLAAITAERPGTTLFLLMGADSLHDLRNWRQPERICELAIPAVVHRVDSPIPDVAVLSGYVPTERLEQIRRSQVEMPLIGLSSTDLRDRAATGRSLRFRTPRAVEKYIETNRLYASDPSP
jgi:nicotinate-nucleotide adenylyltransferase